MLFTGDTWCFVKDKRIPFGTKSHKYLITTTRLTHYDIDGPMSDGRMKGVVFGIIGRVKDPGELAWTQRGLGDISLPEMSAGKYTVRVGVRYQLL